MSAAYEFHATTGTLDEVRALLSSLFEVPLLVRPPWVLPSSTVWVHTLRGEDFEAVEEEFGLAPAVTVRFTNSSSPEGIATVKRAVEALAGRFEGDAVLVFDGDEALWRRRGRVQETLRAGWHDARGYGAGAER